MAKEFDHSYFISHSVIDPKSKSVHLDDQINVEPREKKPYVHCQAMRENLPMCTYNNRKILKE